MYMNRQQPDDFIALSQCAGHRIVATKPTTDEWSRGLLEADRIDLNDTVSGSLAGRATGSFAALNGGDCLSRA